MIDPPADCSSFIASCMTLAEFCPGGKFDDVWAGKLLAVKLSLLAGDLPTPGVLPLLFAVLYARFPRDATTPREDACPPRTPPTRALDWACLLRQNAKACSITFASLSF